MATENAPEFVITDELARKIDRVLDEHEHDATQIVGVLLDVQDLIDQQYVPQSVAFYVAQKLPIKVSVIYDCLTFYSALSPTPRAKYPVQVCRSIACKVNGSDSLLDTVKKILGVEPGEVTYDGRFTIEEVACCGACDVAADPERAVGYDGGAEPALQVQNGRRYPPADRRHYDGL